VSCIGEDGVYCCVEVLGTRLLESDLDLKILFVFLEIKAGDEIILMGRSSLNVFFLWVKLCRRWYGIVVRGVEISGH
jgi:tRNA threonylcarbamoyladenosine modification (KEOPS) complex  Pcc1 subunit